MLKNLTTGIQFVKEQCPEVQLCGSRLHSARRQRSDITGSSTVSVDSDQYHWKQHKKHSSIPSSCLARLVMFPGLQTTFFIYPKQISKCAFPPASSRTYSLSPRALPTTSICWLAPKPSISRRAGGEVHPVTQSVSKQAAVRWCLVLLGWFLSEPRELWGRCSCSTVFVF